MARSSGKIILACSLLALSCGGAAAQDSSLVAGGGPVAGAGLSGQSLALVPPAPRVVPASSAAPVDVDAEDPKEAGAASSSAQRAPLKERMAALLRALYLMSAGGNGRPFPTIPAE